MKQLLTSPRGSGSPYQNNENGPIALEVRGKFLFSGHDKFYVKGVTYGPFRPDEHDDKYHNPEVVNQDFAAIAENGFNAVRTYTVPPRWLLDIASRYGLRVMVGLPLERQAIYFDDEQRIRSMEQWVRTNVRACAGHPAL